MKNNHILMCRDKAIAEIFKKSRKFRILNKELFPPELAFSDTDDIADNFQEFDQWCADRTLPLSRKNVKMICNTLGFPQDQSVKTKAAIARAYHCCTLTDSYWVKKEGEACRWEDVSLFFNKSSNILTPVSLCGKTSTIFNKPLNHADMVVDGTFAKSWVREGKEGYFLLKADDYKQADKVYAEVAASEIIGQLTDHVVLYKAGIYDNTIISRCRCFTDELHAYVPFKALVKKMGHDAALDFVLAQFPEDFALMAVSTYLTGNVDLHNGNWGLIRDMDTGRYVSFAPLFDFNYCFNDDYIGSRNARFIPETKVIDLEAGAEILTDDIEDYHFAFSPVRTLEEAALYYAAKYLQDYGFPEELQIPESLSERQKEELQTRFALVRQALAERVQSEELEDLQTLQQKLENVLDRIRDSLQAGLLEVAEQPEEELPEDAYDGMER